MANITRLETTDAGIIAVYGSGNLTDSLVPQSEGNFGDLFAINDNFDAGSISISVGGDVAVKENTNVLNKLSTMELEFKIAGAGKRLHDYIQGMLGRGAINSLEAPLGAARGKQLTGVLPLVVTTQSINGIENKYAFKTALIMNMESQIGMSASSDDLSRGTTFKVMFSVAFASA